MKLFDVNLSCFYYHSLSVREYELLITKHLSNYKEKFTYSAFDKGNESNSYNGNHNSHIYLNKNASDGFHCSS